MRRPGPRGLSEWDGPPKNNQDKFYPSPIFFPEWALAERARATRAWRTPRVRVLYRHRPCGRLSEAFFSGCVPCVKFNLFLSGVIVAVHHAQTASALHLRNDVPVRGRLPLRKPRSAFLNEPYFFFLTCIRETVSLAIM